MSVDACFECGIGKKRYVSRLRCGTSHELSDLLYHLICVYPEYQLKLSCKALQSSRLCRGRMAR